MQRYARQTILPEIGDSGQAKLKAARVLCVGAGGLGSAILPYLAGAGVGHVGIVDHDTVSLDNLHRQVLYAEKDIGQSKVLCAAERLKSLNAEIGITAYPQKIQRANVMALIETYDLVIDGSDNFATRYLLDDACTIAGKPLVSGAVYRFEGQVTVLNYNGGPTYRCLFPEAPKAALNCSEVGVLGPLPGMVGALQAAEALKIITGAGEVLSGVLWSYDLLDNRARLLKFIRTEGAAARAQQAFEDTDMSIMEISPEELQTQRDTVTVIDVREPVEVAICALTGALTIPLAQLPARLNEIPAGKPVVTMCHHGARSMSAAQLLQARGLKNVTSLKGGIDAWAKDVEPEMARY